MYHRNNKCPYCGRNLSNVPIEKRSSNEVVDYGPNPFVFNIEDATQDNTTFRTTLWTGTFLQLTVMSIPPGEAIGAEIHNNLDQFIRVEQGTGLAQLGYTEDALNFKAHVDPNYAIIIPAGTWHNLINTGNTPLKIYSIYTPPEHPWNTIHETKAIAEAEEENHRN